MKTIVRCFTADFTVMRQPKNEMLYLKVFFFQNDSKSNWKIILKNDYRFNNTVISV